MRRFKVSLAILVAASNWLLRVIVIPSPWLCPQRQAPAAQTLGKQRWFAFGNVLTKFIARELSSLW